eukprot:2350924-Amphidinium_carterae.1
MPTPEGSITGALAPEFREGRINEWLGCTVDLEAAFRQLPVHPKSYRASVLCYYSHKESKPKYIVMKALPFGSKASVG